MNLSFSTNKWNDFNISDFFDIAKEYKFGGFEIHDISKLNDSDIKSAYHKMMEYKVCITCIDMVNDVSTMSEQAFDELEKCIKACQMLNVPYIRLKATSEEGTAEFIEKALPLFKELAKEYGLGQGL